MIFRSTLIVLLLVTAGCNTTSQISQLGSNRASMATPAEQKLLSSSEKERVRLSSNSRVCFLATKKNGEFWTWQTDPENFRYVAEAKRRNLTCKVTVTNPAVVASGSERVTSTAVSKGMETQATPIKLSGMTESSLCARATLDGEWEKRELYREEVKEAKRRGLSCGTDRVQQPAQLSQSVDTLEFERLKSRLAKLEAEKEATKQAISRDTLSPSIRITSTNAEGFRGIISGVASDNTGIAEVLIDGQVIAVDSSGRFTTSTFIPSGGIDIQITAYDLKGLSTTESIRLERTKRTQAVSRLAPVNPLVGPKQKASRDRVALIIGVEEYASAPTADFASRDAQMFADYARGKLGIPDSNIKILTDSEAEETAILRALKVWLPKAVKPDTTDLYVFYAGHGMPTADGASAYLVPYDGDIQLLEDTAISRKRFFDEISATKPRSAIFFFDNCFSGATRSEELLLASRPLGIKVQETSVPDNYLVFTAGEADQIAGVEPDVKHGRFSYFVFKGLEGEADANQDGKISAGELHTYVRESVGRFSAGAQTPTMLGDAGRWIVR